MATNFPTSLDSYTTLVDNVDDVLAAHMNDRGDAIEALEAKVGVDGSTVTTSHDYLLRNLPTQDGTTVVSKLNADKVDGLDSTDIVQTSGAQTIAGVKTFSSIPVLPASDPTSDNEATRKAYVDSKVSTCNDRFDASTGHDHDGTDSKKVLVTNLDATGISAGKYLQSNGTSVVGADSPQTSFGNWESKSSNTVYQAATDGFVVCYAPNMPSSRYFRILTDSSNPPTTVRQQVGNYGENNYHGAATCPVKSGDYWKVQESGTGMTTNIFWIPLGS